MYRKEFPSFSSIHFNNKLVKKIWWMNIGVKETVESNINHFFPQLNTKKQSTITAIEQLCLFQAEKEDIVILREPPPKEVIQCVKISKGYVPIILYTADKHDNYSESILRDNVLLSEIKSLIENSTIPYMVVPFKMTEYDYEISQLLDAKLFGNIPNPLIDINDKIISRNICINLGGNVTKGFTCHDLEDIRESVKILSSEGAVVVKEFDGVSGQGFFIIHDSKSLNIFNTILRRHKKEKKFRLLIEKWYDDSVDINYQIYINNDGEIIQFPSTRQIVNKGVYKGTDFQIENHMNETDMIEIQNFGIDLSKYLYQNNYYGNLSVDTIKAEKKLFHLVEINARLSLSSYYWGIVQNYQCKKIIVQYYDTQTENFSLKDLYDEFCSPIKSEGLLVLSSGLDSLNKIHRVFLMYLADEIDSLLLLKSNVEKFIGEG